MYLPNDKISIQIYEQAKQIEKSFNKFNISTHHKSALYALQKELTGVLTELNYNDTLLTIIGMCEGTIPLDRYFGVCKCCNSNFQRNPKVRQTAPNYHLCKECISTETKYCTIHQECYTDKVCFKCLKEDSHKQYPDSDPDAYVECPVCGYRAIELPSHYDKIHGLTKEQYCDYPLVAEVKKTRYRGPANPWYKHGGKYSPFSKNNIIFDDVEAGIAATLAKTKQTWKDNPGCRSTNIEYWLARGLTEQEARRALKERQSTFSIQKCIERHGEAEGTRIWKERQQKWQETLNTSEKYATRNVIVNTISKPEKEIVSFLHTKGIMVEPQYRIKRDTGSYYRYDIRYNNKLVEYNGDYWHTNPNKYSADFFHQGCNKTAQQIWDRDADKLRVANAAGFDLFVI